MVGSSQFDCGSWTGWNFFDERAFPHMPENVVRLLEVRLVPVRPNYWKWQVCHGDTAVVTEYATSRETAQIDADNALFVELGKI